MKKLLLSWGKRLMIYFLGLFTVSTGVVLSVKSDLGVSPVSSLPNLISRMTGVELGVCTTSVFCLFILVELLLLRREFRAPMLLQILACFLYGGMISLSSAAIHFVPAPTSYPLRLMFLLCSVPLVAGGVMLYLIPDVLPTSGEGMVLAISKKTGLSTGYGKLVIACSLLMISLSVSLVYYHALVGVREGTVICALLVGPVMRRLQRWFQPALLRFVGRSAPA